MEAFVEAFYSVDTDEDEVIYIKDLENYVAKNKLDQTMVTQWKSLFDKKNTGKITLTEFCDTLGLKLAQVRMQRVDSQRSAPSRMNKDIKVIHTNMPMDEQVVVSDEVCRIVKMGGKPADQVGQIKKFLDTKYGRTWHVVIAKGSAWSSYSHMPKTSFFFGLYEHVYLCYRTTE